MASATTSTVAKDKKPKAAARPKSKRVPYRAEGAELLTAFPTDYDRKIHLPLKKKDFQDEAVFFDYRADLAEANAKRFRREAEDSRKLGNTKDKVKAKRLLAMLKRIDAMSAELEAEGVDVSALKASQQDETETVGASGSPAAAV